VAIAQVDEDQPAEIPASMHPAPEPDLTADIGAREPSPGMGAERSGIHRANVTGAQRGIKQSSREKGVNCGVTLLDIEPAQALTTIAAWVKQRGLPGYRTGQIHRRLWLAPVGDWREATELPGSLREELTAAFPLERLRAETIQQSVDGTRKYLWRLADGEAIESVLIPSGRRLTLCISSQAGCALGCSFCATGRMGFRRNLAAGEIVGQLREIVLANPADKPTNVVFMGMGEPLLNWEAVSTALTILNDPAGFAIGARHITVSTVGILPGMAALAARPEQFRLAISLHAPAPAQRLRLMPIQKKYGMDEVLKAARAFRKRITFEYVLIAGKNDADPDADKLAKLARDLGAHVNLLPLHPGGAPGLTPSSGNRIRAFADRLRNQGVVAVVRRSRGLDIDAACGQLFVAQEKKRRTQTSKSLEGPTLKYHMKDKA
jgi:23S rRNA (adenine2503-C2)-methyltransferase